MEQYEEFLEILILYGLKPSHQEIVKMYLTKLMLENHLEIFVLM